LDLHLPDATETGFDLYDLAASNAPANPNPSWLELTSEPYVVLLVTDSRPTNSATIFAADMKAVAPAGTDVSCSNRLRFDFVTPTAPERIYTARIQIDGQFAPPPEGFLCVTNLREVVTQGGFIILPNLSNAPAGTVYGTCELAMRFLDKSSANCHLRLLPIVEPTLTLATDAQIGVRIIDDLEVSTNLVGNNWVRLTSFTNDVIPDPDSFETGWKQITRMVDSSSLPQAPQHYFRLKRSWPTP
jgi:hypothetical protein